MRYTAALLALNVMVFAAYIIPNAGDLPAVYGIVTGDMAAGVPVSLDNLWPGMATYMFGHSGLAHIVMNMVVLVAAGRGLEGCAGMRVIPVYVAGGAVGALVHLTYYGMAGADAPLIGASAAVSGVFGAAAIYRAVGAGSILYFVVALNILPLAGVTTGIIPDGGVSFVSHLGGAAAGMIFGACFMVCGRINGRRRGRAVMVDPGWMADARRECGRQPV